MSAHERLKNCRSDHKGEIADAIDALVEVIEGCEDCCSSVTISVYRDRLMTLAENIGSELRGPSADPEPEPEPEPEPAPEPELDEEEEEEEE